MWQRFFHLLEQDNVASAKALWTSKSTFISMTLNLLPIKDKSPFHTQSSICQCHHTKEKGNLFMPNMPPISTFSCPFEHCFLIKRGSLSWFHFFSPFFFLNRNISLILLASAWNSHDNISFNYSFIVTTIQLPFNLSLSSSSNYIPAKRECDTWACIEIALISTHHTLAGAIAFICRQRGTRRLKRSSGVATGGRRGTDEWSWVQRAGTQLTQLPSSVPRLLSSSHWQAADWGLRLAATFSQKAIEIQYRE